MPDGAQGLAVDGGGFGGDGTGFTFANGPDDDVTRDRPDGADAPRLRSAAS